MLIEIYNNEHKLIKAMKVKEIVDSIIRNYPIGCYIKEIKKG